jgi:hypothetical protein
VASAFDDVRVVEVGGTPRERGRAHGEALRPLIHEGVERWQQRIQQTTRTAPVEYVERFLATSDFLPAIEKWAPDLLEEVRGIAEGGSLPFDVAYAYQLMDEEWFFRFEYLQSEQAQRDDHCSTVGVWGDSKTTVLAQNMDLPKTYEGTQALLRLGHPDGVEALVFTASGLIGTTGLNSHSIGVCVNSIPQLGYAHCGLPVAFLIRRLLQHRSWDEAVAYARSVTHASAQNVAVGGLERVADFECSPSRVIEYTVGETWMCHTNHPLAHQTQPLAGQGVLSPSFGKGSESAPVVTQPTDSEQRFAFLEGLLREHTKPLTVERVKELLSTCSPPVSVSRTSEGGGVTLGSLVMELGRPAVLHLAPGPPAETEYHTFVL